MCYNSQVGSELVMKIIVSAGGTGGHLYPALALVEMCIRDRYKTV